MAISACVCLEMFAVGELADEIQVCGEKVVAGEGTEGRPAHFVEDPVFKFALELTDEEELKIDGGAIAIAMTQAGDVATDGGVDTELLIEFACESDLRGLTSFDLSARELPLEAHRLVWAALADEYLTTASVQLTKNQRGHNIADRWRDEGVSVPLQFANRLFH